MFSLSLSSFSPAFARTRAHNCRVSCSLTFSVFAFQQQQNRERIINKLNTFDRWEKNKKRHNLVLSTSFSHFVVCFFRFGLPLLLAFSYTLNENRTRSWLKNRALARFHRMHSLLLAHQTQSLTYNIHIFFFFLTYICKSSANRNGTVSLTACFISFFVYREQFLFFDLFLCWICGAFAITESSFFLVLNIFFFFILFLFAFVCYVVPAHLPQDHEKITLHEQKRNATK